MRKITLALALTAATATTASHADVNGNGLLELCGDPRESNGHNLCAFYSLGVVDGLEFGAAGAAGRTGLDTSAVKTICPPAGYTGIQLADIVLKWLEDNPANRAEHGALVVIRAMRDAFPCDW